MGLTEPSSSYSSVLLKAAAVCENSSSRRSVAWRIPFSSAASSWGCRFVFGRWRKRSIVASNSARWELAAAVASAPTTILCKCIEHAFGCQASQAPRSEEHTSELQSQSNLVCRLLLEKKKTTTLSQASRSHTHRAVATWSLRERAVCMRLARSPMLSASAGSMLQWMSSRSAPNSDEPHCASLGETPRELTGRQEDPRAVVEGGGEPRAEANAYVHKGRAWRSSKGGDEDQRLCGVFFF